MRENINPKTNYYEKIIKITVEKNEWFRMSRGMSLSSRNNFWASRIRSIPYLPAVFGAV